MAKRIKILPELYTANKSFWVSLTLQMKNRPLRDNTINLEIDYWEKDKITKKESTKVEQWIFLMLIEELQRGKDRIELKENKLRIGKSGSFEEHEIPRRNPLPSKNCSITNDGSNVKIKIGELEFECDATIFNAWFEEIKRFTIRVLDKYYLDLYRLAGRGEDYDNRRERFDQDSESSN